MFGVVAGLGRVLAIGAEIDQGGVIFCEIGDVADVRLARDRQTVGDLHGAHEASRNFSIYNLLNHILLSRQTYLRVHGNVSSGQAGLRRGGRRRRWPRATMSRWRWPLP